MRLFSSLRSRILALVLASALLPLTLLSFVLARETKDLLTLWQPIRLNRGLSASLETQRILLNTQGETQGNWVERLASGGIDSASIPAGYLIQSPRGAQTLPPTLAGRVEERLPADRPGLTGPEPPFRILYLPAPDGDYLVAAARNRTDPPTAPDWTLIARRFPAGTLERLEELGRDIAYLNRLEEITAVAGTALGIMVLAIASLAAIVAILLAFFLARSVTRPVEELARGMAQLGEGDPLPPVHPRGATEVRFLAIAFNRLSSQLKEAQARLAAQSRSLGFRDSARHVAHETKNALTPILSALGVLKPHLEPAGEAPNRALRLIEAEAARLERLAAAFSRLGHLPPPQPQWINPIDSLRRALSLYLPPAISITPDDLGNLTGAGPGMSRVLIDPESLDAVWVNLVKNAAEAMPEGGSIRLEIWNDGEDEHPSLHIVLIDSGPGLPKGGETRLFEPGYTTKNEGSGLGLYVSRLLLRAAGGDLKLEPDPQGGARAHVVLRLTL
ncbi:MAG: HAMP domain-containing histidine kinase [Candidatus Eisenbacteria bacterium]|nr:HAMP domain-containing histidine kinase [Candidatus Eisenbacteria bacterium]